MKKSPFIWIVIIVLGLYVISTIGSVIYRLSDITSYMNTVSTSMPIFIFGIIINVITIIVSGLFVAKLYKMSADSIKWSKIAFTVSVVTSLIEFAFTYMNSARIEHFTATITSEIVVTIITIIIWLAFINHLRKVINTSNIQK